MSPRMVNSLHSIIHTYMHACMHRERERERKLFLAGPPGRSNWRLAARRSLAWGCWSLGPACLSLFLQDDSDCTRTSSRSDKIEARLTMQSPATRIMSPVLEMSTAARSTYCMPSR